MYRRYDTKADPLINYDQGRARAGTGVPEPGVADGPLA